MSYAASMNADEFKNRTKTFAIRVIRLVEALPKNQTAKVIGNQLLRCGTSVGTNYRAACRAKSPADFVAKMAVVEEECDESIYWMELIEAGLMDEKRLIDLKKRNSFNGRSLHKNRTIPQIIRIPNPKSAITAPPVSLGR